MGARWTRSFKDDFNFTAEKLRMSTSKPELLLQPRWNIPPWAWLLYRLSAVLYTFSWCVYTALLFNTPKWLIFLSHISYCLMGLYYLSALCNLAAAFALVRRRCRSKREGSFAGYLGPLPAPLGFSVRLQWLIHIAQSSLSLAVSLIYWTVNYPVTRHPVSSFSVNLHVVNSLQSLLDLALSATPFHLCHLLYALVTGSLYMLFLVLYWLAGFTNITGQPYVYSVLNFGERPLVATLCVLGFSLVCLPSCHFTLWNVCLLRELLAARSRGRPAVLQREMWWWGAVGGWLGHRPVPCLDPAASVFGPAGGGHGEDEPQSPLPMATYSYHTVMPSA